MVHLLGDEYVDPGVRLVCCAAVADTPEVEQEIAAKGKVRPGVWIMHGCARSVTSSSIRTAPSHTAWLPETAQGEHLTGDTIGCPAGGRKTQTIAVA